jgi:Ca-activated chloride channel family protein
MMCLSRHRNANQLARSVPAGIPSKALVHSGIFASHFFDINPDLETITALVAAKLFSSQFTNPLNGNQERILVLGITGSEDGQYRRHKTDFVFVLDKSGSMSTPLGHTFIAMSRGRASTQSAEKQRPTMQLTQDAAKGMFDLIDEDEEIGLLVFDHGVAELSPLTVKSEIDRGSLFDRIDAVRPGGSTNFEIALTAAIAMIRRSSNPDRNKRIIFLTDATPTAGGSVEVIRYLSERAFVESKGVVGITYIGVGLSFNAEACAELSRIHSSTVFTIGNWADLAELLKSEFNYLVSPVAFDVRVALSIADYSISEVFGGDSDCQKGEAVLSFRTMTASSIGAEGVKGSVIVIHLTPRAVMDRSLVHITIEYTPFGEQNPTVQEHEYLLNDDPTPVTEKSYALSVYYRTLQELLPAPHVRKERFEEAEAATLTKLLTFLNSQHEGITTALRAEISTVSGLIAKYCEVGHPSAPALVTKDD